MTGDKVTITISLERMEDGTAKIDKSIEGSGFFTFEIVGLLQIATWELSKQSLILAKDLSKDDTIEEYKK